jgi:hypothetical protein
MDFLLRLEVGLLAIRSNGESQSKEGSDQWQ